MSAAQKAPGVKATLVWRDPANTQRNTVMFQGDEIAAVAADTEERAIDAARLVKVEYEVLPARRSAWIGARGQRAGGVPGGNVRQGADAGNGRPRRRLQAGCVHTSSRPTRRT